MNILFAGDYDPDYNRNKILIAGLKKTKDINLTQYRFFNDKDCEHHKLKDLISENDIVYSPSFSHKTVKILKKYANNKPLVFDPLISKYLTKVFDYKKVSRFSPRALKNYLKDKIPLTSSDLIFSDTEEHKKYFINKFKISSDKIKTLYIGADITEFYPIQNNKNKSFFEIGFYGGFIPLQGVEMIVKAANILKNEKDIHFNLIGSGFEFERINKLVSDFKLENIIFHGWLEREDLINKINAFDLCLGIFGNTPKTEMVIPNKIYHYAALKKCIITKDTPAIREVFKNNENIVLTAGKPDDIAENILIYKKNYEDRNKIASNVYNLIKNSYNQNIIAATAVSYFKNIISKQLA